MFIDHLPEESHNQRWSIITSYGGLETAVRKVVNASEQGRVVPIDLTIFRDDQNARLRVTPALGSIRQDPLHATRYYFEQAVGIFLDRQGEPTGNWVNLTASVNTQSTAEGDPTGFLIAWQSGESHPSLLHDTRE